MDSWSGVPTKRFLLIAAIFLTAAHAVPSKRITVTCAFIKEASAQAEGRGWLLQLARPHYRAVEAMSMQRLIDHLPNIFVLFILAGFTGPSSRTVYIDEHPSSG